MDGSFRDRPGFLCLMPMSPSPIQDREASGILLGLAGRPFSIPSKFFYDDVGSALFDRICDLPEYYLTRSERSLLDQCSEEIAAVTAANVMVELGAGTARKTRHLIQSLLDRKGTLRYVPMDISRYALDQAETSLAKAFPGLSISGLLCDYTRSLVELTPSPGCLAVFLGSTIGNFSHDEGVDLLSRLRERLAPGDWFLLGVDLVKSKDILEAAYNDSAGVTAEFNKNILRVVNRLAPADFQVDDFHHLAFYNEEESQIEMHLVARRDTRVTLGHAGAELAIQAGERIRTEVSRKFTRASTEDLLQAAGFRLRRWFVPPDGFFALALASV